MSNNIPGTDQFQEDGSEAVNPSVEPVQDIVLSRNAARRDARAKTQSSLQSKERQISPRKARKHFEKALKASTLAQSSAPKGSDLKPKRKAVFGRIAFTGVAVLAIAGFGAGIILPNLGAVADPAAITGELIPNAVAKPLSAQSLAIESYDSAAAPALTRDAYKAEAPPLPVVQQVSQRWSYHLGTFSNDPNAKVQWPFASSPISSPYGPRWGGMHTGTDFDMPFHAPIGAVSAGKVVAAGWNVVGGCGYGVLIDHGTIGGQKISSLSCHMTANSSPVRSGQEVVAGQMIGKVGATGMATGAHLHLEIWVNGNPFGKGGQWADPYRWLKTHAG